MVKNLREKLLLSMNSENINYEEISDNFLKYSVSLLKRTGISIKPKKGIDAWYNYEMDLWMFSEKIIRPFLKKHKKVRGKHIFLDTLIEICLNRKFEKGRQLLVLFVGQYGKDAYKEEIKSLLYDSEMQGYAIDALRYAKCFEYVDIIKEIYINSKPGWIRQAAKKYINKAETIKEKDK